MMGVGGLTTFVDDNNHLLKNHRLHDTRVVIDGNNLYHFLYKYYQVNYRLGGDLNEYADCVREYFNTLRACNIQPIVVFDGAYALDDRKLKTVINRANNRISDIVGIIKGSRGRLTSTFASRVFKNVLSELAIPHVTCTFEADDEIAALANAYSCPVMSNDSDFFIYDLKGGFIVFDYVNLQILTNEISDVDSVNRSTTGATDENSQACATDKSGADPYKYLAVQIYFTDNLVNSFPGLSKSMLPLFACLYGNDVLKRGYFSAFYRNIHLYAPSLRNLATKWTSPKRKHDLILRLLLWLDDSESYQVAMETVLKAISSDKKIDVQKVRNLLELCIASYSIGQGYLQSYFDTGEMKWLVESATGTCMLGPTWFLKTSHTGQFESFVLNVHFAQRALLRCQLDDIKQASTYQCASSLRRILFSIICGEKHTSVREFDRFGISYGSKQVNTIAALPCGRKIPTLDKVPEVSHDEKFEFLLDTFEIKDHGAMADVNRHLVLFILSAVFWIRHSSPPVDNLYLLSLLLSTLKIAIDLKLRLKDSDKGKTHFLHTLLRDCPEEVLLIVQDKLQKFCQEPRASNLIYMNNVHANANFQAVLQAALELNSVLQNVVRPPCPSHILCSSLMYNLYRTLHKRTDAKHYVEHLLDRNAQLIGIMDKLRGIITRLLPEDALTAPSGGKSKKNRKRKLKRKEVTSSGNSSSGEEEPRTAGVTDLAGNRFQLLALADVY